MTVLSSTRLSGITRHIPGSVPLWNAGLFLVIVALATAYVLQISSVTKQGYAIRDLEMSVDELRLQSEQLKVAVASAKSLDAVTERMQILGFVEPAEVVYVPSGAVAKR